jgi:diguanylate cyclase (GGDEF)-like protein
VRDEDAGMEELAETISRDPALVVKLLKLANSPLFNTGREIKDVHQATVMLGMRTVQLMSLSFSLTSSLPRDGDLGGYPLGSYWKRALLLAVAARSMAGIVRHPEFEGEAFVCGVLSNIGQIVLAMCLPDLYAPVLREAEDRWPTRALEQRVLGFQSNEVAYVLLSKWGLPPSTCDTVLAASGAPLPDEREPMNPALVEAMILAQLVVSVLCDEDNGSALIDLHVRSKVHGVTPNDIAQLLIGLETDLVEMAEMMEIDLPEGRSHSTIMEEARQQIVALSLNTASAATRLEKENRQLETRANTDELTGLANRRAFDALLGKEVLARVNRKMPGALGLLLLDIDHFKRFNDTWGHQAGDAVLAAVGRLLTDVTRSKETASRYGGEEFAVVIPLANPGILSVVGERIRSAIEGLQVEWEGRFLRVTISVGGASVSNPGSIHGGEKLVKLADEQLYLAKLAGRNRVSIADRTANFAE